MIINDKNNILGGGSRDTDELSMHEIIRRVYEALEEKGYNPINQLVGYILSEDPTYITNYNNARGLIRRVDRDKLLVALLSSYLGLEEQDQITQPAEEQDKDSNHEEQQDAESEL